MTEAHPCLLSIRKTSSKYKHFPFLENQIKIGRSNDVTYTILSDTISRCHAIIKKQGDDTWTITDNKSLNGIAVNGTVIRPLEPYTLQEGDIVQLGVPKDATVPAEFVYRYFSSLKVRREPKASSRQVKSEAGGSSSTHLPAETRHGAGVSKKRSRPVSENEPVEDKRLKLSYEGKLQALAQQLKEKEREKSAIAQQLQEERQHRQVMEQQQKEQEKKVSQLGARQKQLMAERAAAEAQIRRQLEEQLREREAQLRRQMQQKLTTLTAEKKDVEDRLQKEMEKAVREKDQELQCRLQEEKDRLQKVIETKELEQKALESKLAESRVENEKAKADTLMTREAVLSEFADTMETELQCSICSELFVKATSLNCSHAFCALCLRQWLAVKRECPNCRTPVTSQMRSIVLDNYIDRMVEQLSGEMKDRRAALVAERKEAEDRLDEEENGDRAGPSRTANTRQQRGRGRGRGRQAGVSRRVGHPEVAATVIHDSSDSSSADNEADARSSRSEVVITDSDEEEEELSSEYSDSSDSSVALQNRSHARVLSDSEDDSVDEDGIERGYYGGYGRCFSCGRDGHWANQCPG